MRHLNRNRTPIIPKPIYIARKTFDGASIEVALQYSDDYNETDLHLRQQHQHARRRHPPDRLPLRAHPHASTTMRRKTGLLEEKETNLTGDDVREGLTAIISVKVPNPQFEGQTKDKLGNAEVRTVTETLVNDELFAYLEENPSRRAAGSSRSA